MDEAAVLMQRNTMAAIREEMLQLEHLYNAYQRTGDPELAQRARKLLKRMRKQFKQLADDFGISKNEFNVMLRDWDRR